MTEARALAFDSQLGWFAVEMRDGGVSRLTFAHRSAAEALRAICQTDCDDISVRHPLGKLARRLQAYAQGANDDFLDIPLNLGAQTEFQQAVTEACRRIPPGDTLSYAELAEQVGSPGAARAVGNCMAKNPVPIIVPCHRVLASGGKLGGYSMGEGLPVKRRLLRLERVPQFV